MLKPVSGVAAGEVRDAPSHSAVASVLNCRLPAACVCCGRMFHRSRRMCAPNWNLVLALHLGGIVFQDVVSEEAGAAIGRLKVVSRPDAEVAEHREPGDVQRIGSAELVGIVNARVAGQNVGVLARAAHQQLIDQRRRQRSSPN